MFKNVLVRILSVKHKLFYLYLASTGIFLQCGIVLYKDENFSLMKFNDNLPLNCAK